MRELLKLLLPIAAVAEAGGGAAGAAGGTDGAAGAAGEAEPATGDAHFAEMRQAQEERAGLATEAGTDEEAGAAEQTAAGAQGTDTAAAAAAADAGKGAKAEYVPKERFDEVLGQLKDMRTELENLKKGGTQTQQTETAEPAWKSKLKPLPSKEGKLVDGKRVDWESTEEYLDARQDVLNHNAQVERDGKAAETKAADDAKAANERNAQLARDRHTNYVEKTVPAFLKAENLTLEQFNGALEKAPNVPVLDAGTGDMIGAAILQLSKDAARFNYAIATATPEVLTPYAAEVMAAAPGPARTAKIIEVVGRMDALLSHGLGLDGKPRAAAAKGGGALTTGAASERSGANRASTSTTVVQSATGGASAGGEEQATGDAHFAQMRAAETRKRQARAAGLKR